MREHCATTLGLVLLCVAVVNTGAVSIRGFANSTAATHSGHVGNSTPSATRTIRAGAVSGVRKKEQISLATKKDSTVISGSKSTYRTHEVRVFDPFFFLYWGTVAGTLIFFLTYGYRELWLPKIGASRETMSRIASKRRPTSARQSDREASTETPETMWSMVLLTSVGQATFENGTLIPTWSVFVVSMMMAAGQIIILYLIMHDMDPHRDPVTTVPSAPSHTAWTVNYMKWLMMVVFCMQAVNEVDEAKDIVYLSYRMNDKHFIDHPKARRAITLFVGFCQYLVTLCLVWTGAAVILNFQNCPDIIFSSLALTFVAKIDDIFAEFFESALDINVDFKIDFRFAEGDVTQQNIPFWIVVTKRFASLFPLLLGFFIFAHAWYTNAMPLIAAHSEIIKWSPA